MFTIMVKSQCLAVKPGFVLHSHLAMRVLMSSSLGTRTWQGSIAFSWSYLQAVAGGEAQGAGVRQEGYRSGHTCTHKG